MNGLAIFSCEEIVSAACLRNRISSQPLYERVSNGNCPCATSGMTKSDCVGFQIDIILSQGQSFVNACSSGRPTLDRRSRRQFPGEKETDQVEAH